MSEDFLSRRRLLHSTAWGLLGFGAGWVRAADRPVPRNSGTPKSVIYVFLSGGLAQQDSFDPKPEAPPEIRGEFDPIATRSPGVHVCEHLPRLAQRSDRFSLVRSLTHPYNEHSQGHMVMLSGRSDLPTGFNPGMPQPTDHPSIAAIAGALLPDQQSLPPAIVLPERIIHRTGRVIPGQFGGVMGAHRDPYILSASPYNARSYGAWPEYGFHHQQGGDPAEGLEFTTPNLSRPDGVSETRTRRRLQLLDHFEGIGEPLGRLQEMSSFSRYRDRAISLLNDPGMKELFNVTDADAATLDRYGRNTFGWSLLLARRLVREGVRFVQVNLGNNETWDTHGNAFPHLKNYLLPPFDIALSGLLDDLHETGELEQTLIVVAGEFGRTPKVFGLPQHYKLPGRDHWGKVQTALLAGGGLPGGTVVGSSDSVGGAPESETQRPENLAATIYRTLGFPADAHWYDLQNRPIPLYHADPIPLSG
jgi:hypothetical protein